MLFLHLLNYILAGQQDITSVLSQINLSMQEIKQIVTQMSNQFGTHFSNTRNLNQVPDYIGFELAKIAQNKSSTNPQISINSSDKMLETNNQLGNRSRRNTIPNPLI